MNKAQELSDWARQSIIALSHDPEFGSRHAVYLWLSQKTGLSVSYLQKFTQRERHHPRVDTVDKLVEGVSAAKAVVAKRAEA